MWISSSQSGYDEKNPLTHNFHRTTESEAGKTQSAHPADLLSSQPRRKLSFKPNSCRKHQLLGQTYTKFNSIYSPITTDSIVNYRYLFCIYVVYMACFLFQLIWFQLPASGKALRDAESVFLV